MVHLQTLGPLALASRLKNLSDKLMQGVARIYREMDVDFEPRWFPVTHYLYSHGAVSVTTLASELQQTHPAVLQVTGMMNRKGLIKLEKDENDLRKTIISLTPTGRELAENLTETWARIASATADLLEETGTDLIKDLAHLELALERKGIYDRIKNKKVL